MPDNLFAERWNSVVLGKGDLANVMRQAHQTALEKGICYRLPTDLLQGGRPTVFWQMRSDVAATSWGLPVVGLVPNLPATPGFITLAEEEKIRRLGRILYAVVGSLPKLMEVDQEVRATIGRSPQVSEMYSFGVDPGYRDPLLMRIDYVWREMSEADYEPVVVDVNLLPGFTVLTLDMGDLCDEFFAGLVPHLWTGMRRSGSGSILPLVTAVESAYREWSISYGRGTSSFPRIGHAVREAHGLEPEQRRWLSVFRSLSPDFWGKAEVTYPHQRSRQGWGDLDLVVRQVREYWGRSASAAHSDEEVGIRRLVESYRRGEVCCFPPFGLWREDHQWFHFYRTRRDHFVSILGEEDYRWFCSLLPETAVVGNGNLLTEQGRMDLSPNLFRDGVLKRGDSTSCRDLRILTKASSGMRQSVLEYCLGHWQEGLVWQQFVRPSKSKVVAINAGGDPFLFEGNTKYSAYYVNGEYLCGNFMVAEGSKVHGGSGTLLGPLYVVTR